MKEIVYYEGGEGLEQVAHRIMNAFCLDVFKAKLDGILSNLF